MPEAKELDARPDKRIITHSPYSEGARQMAWKHLHHLAPARKVVMGSKTYADDFAQSKVCLAALDRVGASVSYGRSALTACALTALQAGGRVLF